MEWEGDLFFLLFVSHVSSLRAELSISQNEWCKLVLDSTGIDDNTPSGGNRLKRFNYNTTITVTDDIWRQFCLIFVSQEWTHGSQTHVPREVSAKSVMEVPSWTRTMADTPGLATIGTLVGPPLTWPSSPTSSLAPRCAAAAPTTCTPGTAPQCVSLSYVTLQHADIVWGKVMFSHMSVCLPLGLFTGECHDLLCGTPSPNAQPQTCSNVFTWGTSLTQHSQTC